MDPRRDTENLEATQIEDDDDLELEDDDELDDFDDVEDDDDDLDDADDEAELSQAELPNSGRDTERELDHGLKETFPASDPVSINPGAD